MGLLEHAHSQHTTHTHTHILSGFPAPFWQLGWQKANSKPSALDGNLTSHWRALEPGARWVSLHTHTHIHTHPSDRLTKVIESPFALRSFHHRSNLPHHTGGVCVSTKHACCRWCVCKCIYISHVMIYRQKVYLHLFEWVQECVCIYLSAQMV